MKYYKLKRDLLLRYKNSGELQLVKHELLTSKQVEKLGYFSGIVKKNSDLIKHSNKQIYWFFGARFQINKL